MKRIHLQGKEIALFLIFIMLFSAVRSATITSTATGGPWGAGSTWVGGAVPLTGDAVVIATTGSGEVQITKIFTQTTTGSVTVNSGANLINNISRGTITFGSLTIKSGGTATFNNNISVLGTTDITGVINFGSINTTSRNMQFAGLVTINAGGVWNETTTGAAATINFKGGVTNNGTFKAQAPIHTFSTNAQILNGGFSIPNVTVTGITLSNNGILDVNTALAGTGTLSNGVSGILELGGTTTINSLNAAAVGNTVNYYGVAQTAKVASYSKLILSGSGIKTFATTPTINGILSMEGTASIVVTNGVVTYGTGATLQYNKPTSFIATTEEWITPFTATGGITITNTGSITAPAGRTMGSGSSLNLQNGILVAGSNITMASTSTINRSEGSMTGTPVGTGLYNVNYTGNSKVTGPELSGSGLNNVTVNLATASGTLSSEATGFAFTVGNNLTITQGNLILAATNADYTIKNDLIVSANGTLTHSVYWDGTNKLLRINGNIAIDGKFAYTVRSHVQMGSGNKTIRTGTAPSALSILTLAHTSGTISASGPVTVNDNFWASFNASGGTFATSNYTVYAKASLLNAGGTVLINGGTLNVTGGLLIGTSYSNGSVILNSGTLNTDDVNIGEGALTGTFSQTGGTANISGNLLLNPSCTYVCTNSPVINIGGKWTNNGGTFTAASGTVTFNGSGAQEITGTAASQAFNNFIVNKSSNTLSVTGSTSTLTVNDFTETAGNFTAPVTLNINGNATLTSGIFTVGTSTNIAGNWSKNGATFIPGTGTVIFNGSAKTIGGSAVTTFNNLVVNGTISLATTASPARTTVSNALTINSNKNLAISAGQQLTVAGTLTNNAGSSGLLVASTSAGTGSLLNNTVGVSATVERYIGGASFSWHFLSSPVTSQPINGGFTPSPATSYDFYSWSEPYQTWVNFKNTTATPTWNDVNGTTNFIPGRGYLVAYQATNTTKSFSGTLNAGTVSYSLTKAGNATFNYFNLVGNPYPCSIDWEAASGWGRGNLSGTQKSYWVWNDATGNYGAYITGSYGYGTNGVTNFISPGQGFIVLAATEGTLTMDNGVKVHSQQAYLKGAETSKEELRLRLSCDINAYSDETMVLFNHSDPDNGSEKFSSLYTDAPELWSVKNGNKYSINYMGDLGSDKIVPLVVKAGTAGRYTLSASEVESFGGNSAISLEDRPAGTYTFLSANPSYTFEVNSPGTITDRFFLHFMDVTGIANTIAAQDFTIYAADGIIHIQSLKQQSGKIAINDMLGRTITTGRVEADGIAEINMNGKPGVYIVSVYTNKGISSTKIMVSK